ncbi:MAG: hypothetical protein AB7R89_27000 [Dehalococcoidia bacterium]
MDTAHLRHHIQDLAGRRYFLRTLRPDGERYKLWLGDLVEFVNVTYGPDSEEMAALRATLTSRPRLGADATEAERVRDYLDRLDALAALLDRYERTIHSP